MTTATAVANRFTSSSETKLISNIAYAITNMQLTRGLFDNVKSGCEQAAVLGLGLISSYAIEQLANETIPGNPAPENWERYMGPVTYLALATTCTFFATLFVNKVWRQNK